MKTKRPLLRRAGPILLVLAGWGLAGCAGVPAPRRAAVPARLDAAARPPASLPPEWLRPSDAPFRLGPGDRLEIETIGDPATRASTLVGPDGKIYYDLLPGLDVWGLTLAEARAALEEAMRQFLREPPRLSLTLHAVGSQHVWLLGRLSAPGIYLLTGPTTLLEAIARAGGPAPTPVFATLTTGGTATFTGGSDEAADLDRAFLVRAGRPLPVNFRRLLREGDMGQNLYLEPDDLIYLPSAVSQEVYVLGAVLDSRAVDYTPQTTLVSALARAGGTVKDAHLAQVAVVRGGVGDPRIAVYDFDAVRKGRAPDVLLEAHDIVYVPRAPYRVLTRYLDLILTTFARTVGVNAGARAVSRGEAIGISVPVGP